jgi:hypothetical protein
LHTVRKKIVTDEEHRPVAVLVEYDDWLEIERLLELRDGEPLVDLSPFVGTMKLSEDPLAYQRRIREEWP